MHSQRLKQENACSRHSAPNAHTYRLELQLCCCSHSKEPLLNTFLSGITVVRSCFQVLGGTGGSAARQSCGYIRLDSQGYVPQRHRDTGPHTGAQAAGSPLFFQGTIRYRTPGWGGGRHSSDSAIRMMSPCHLWTSQHQQTTEAGMCL